MRKRTTFLRLVLAATVIIVGLPNAPLFAAAAPGARQKISADLNQQVDGGRGSDRVNIIVQFNRAPATVIDRVLAIVGARVIRRLNTINVRVLELPVHAVPRWRHRRRSDLSRLTGQSQISGTLRRPLESRPDASKQPQRSAG
jgi:hypothetical protein